MMASMGYYGSLGSENKNQFRVPGIDFNATLRFEVMVEKEGGDSSQDFNKPKQAYFQMLLDDLPLPCDKGGVTKVCPLNSFISHLSSQVLIYSREVSHDSLIHDTPVKDVCSLLSWAKKALCSNNKKFHTKIILLPFKR